MGRIISAVVMASGFSKRMGQDKLLMPIQKGHHTATVIQWTLRALQQSMIERILIVYRSEAVKEAFQDEGVVCCYNPRADEGQSASIRLGIQEVCSLWPETEGILFVPGDMAVLTAEVVDQLGQVFQATNGPAIVYPVVQNAQKAPVLFDQSFFDALSALEGDRGGRQLLINSTKYGIPVPFENGDPFEDIDSIEDFLRIESLMAMPK